MKHVEASQGLTRRQLITRGALAAVGVVFGGSALRIWGYIRAHSAPGLSVLSPREVRVLRHLLTAFFPGGEGMPKANTDVLIPNIDEHLSQADEDARLLFRSMLHVVEDQSLLFHGARFSALSAQAQMEEVRAWELTPVYLKRKSFQSLKFVSAMFYAEQEDVRAAIGWYLGCAPVHLRPSVVGV